MPSVPLKNRRNGFTLIEIAIVMIISGLILSAFLPMVAIRMKTHKSEVTRENLKIAEEALSAYLHLNYRYPCPAERELVRGDAQFGRAPKTCYEPKDTSSISAEISTKDASLISAPGTGDEEVMIGLLPFRSLGIPDSAATDGWGNILHYAVTARLTDPYSYTQNGGAIDVIAEDKVSRVMPPGSVQFVILSTGENGKGGITSEGVSTFPCDKKSLENENCNDDATFMDTRYTVKPNKRRQSIVDYDDILVYRQFDPSFNAGGLLVLFQGQCPANFNEIKIDSARQAGDLPVLTHKANSVITDAHKNGSVALCYSPYYSKTLGITLRGSKGGSDNVCPEGWVEIGYKSEEGGRFGNYIETFQVCAK